MAKLTVIFFALLAALGQAQTAYRSPYPLFLLNYQTVQRDLGLSQTAVKKIGEIQKGYEKRNLAMLQPLPGAPDTIRRPSAADIESNMKNADTAKLALLSEAQRSRLKQIGLQYEGAFGLSEDSTRQALKLTAKQQTALKTAGVAAIKGFRAKTSLIVKVGTSGPKKGHDPVGNMKRLAEARLAMMQQLDATAAKILTATQLAQWKQMKGKPFPVASLYVPLPNAAFSVLSGSRRTIPIRLKPHG
jgi:hypothetical protein